MGTEERRDAYERRNKEIRFVQIPLGYFSCGHHLRNLRAVPDLQVSKKEQLTDSLKAVPGARSFLFKGEMKTMQYTVSLVARILDVNPEVVRRWIRDGKLEAKQHSRKEGNRIDEEALEDFVKRHPRYKRRMETEFFVREQINALQLDGNNQRALIRKLTMDVDNIERELEKLYSVLGSFTRRRM